MYGILADFLQDLASAQPWLWTLLVLAVVLGAALLLYLFWEAVLRLLLPGRRREILGGRRRE